MSNRYRSLTQYRELTNEPSMGYSVLSGSSYDTQECAKRCNDAKGCQSFNLYYERAPSVDPSDACTNPVSQTVLKCVYYGGPVSQATATNDGQWRRDFHVLIAGSNGYVNKAIATPDGYQPAISLGQVTMNVPVKDCAGNPTYLGVKTFQDGPFSADKCAAACTATSDFDRANPHVWVNGKPRLCQMFVTYILYNGTTATGQFCAMYDQSWPTSFATERGQWRDNGKSWFNMDYSYMFYNTTGGADKALTSATCDNPPAPNQPGVCRNGQFWSTSAKYCMSYVTCDANTQYLNKNTNACVTCDSTKEYLDKDLQKCVVFPTCDPDKQYLDKTTNKCAGYPACDSATQYLDKDQKKCITYPTCDSATQYLDKTSNKCATYPTCDASTQYLDKTSAKCVAYPTCDSTTQYLDKDQKACVSYPTCSSGQALNKATKLCETTAVQKNLLNNPGFESGSGSNVQGWTLYGSGTHSISNTYPDTGSQHYLGKFRQGANGLQLTQQGIKGFEVGKIYKLRTRYGLGVNRNFAGGSCTIGVSFSGLGGMGLPYGMNLYDADLINAPPGTYKTRDYWITLPYGTTTPNPNGENIGFSMSCGNFQGLSVDVLIDSVLIVDPSLSGDLVPQFPTCDPDTQWLLDAQDTGPYQPVPSRDTTKCNNYPVCDASKYQVLNKDTKACETKADATCENLAELAAGGQYTSNGRSFDLKCKTSVTGTLLQNPSTVKGYKACIDSCRYTYYQNCYAVSYEASTKTCTLLRNKDAAIGESSVTLDGAKVIGGP